MHMLPTLGFEVKNQNGIYIYIYMMPIIISVSPCCSNSDHNHKQKNKTTSRLDNNLCFKILLHFVPVVVVVNLSL